MAHPIRIPWLHDRHSHTSIYAAFAGCPSLAELDTAGALATLRGLPEDRLSIAFGWHSARAPLSDRDLADLPPALIVNLSMHGFVLTEAGVPLLAELEPEVVAHRTDPEWCERHLPRLLALFGQTARLTPAKLATFMAQAEALGLGGVDDMLLPDEATFQIILGSPWADRIRCWATPRAFRTLSPASQGALAGLKFFTDGALGARSAALGGTFLDGTEGVLLHRDEALLQALGESHAFGKAVVIHAIGDRAIGQVLEVLERLAADGMSFPLARLEHAQFIDEAQARRAKALGVVLCMQPNFSSDSRDYADRLAAPWLARNNPFRMLIDRAGFVPGQDLIFGSDGMPHGVEAALQAALFPPHPGQRLSVEELVAGYGPASAGRGHCLVEIDETHQRVRLLESRRDD
ncbi:MAG: amidohydrolase family protein [Holophagaceae bacterium]